MKKRIITAAVLLLAALAYIFYENQKNTTEASIQLFAMDTYMELTVYGKNAGETAKQAQTEIERLDALLSTGSSESEVSTLNRDKKGTVSEDCAYLLEQSLKLYDMTQGAFDITIYPVMRAWGFTGEAFRIPEKEELARLLTYVDASKLEYDAATHAFSMPTECEIDFGGIAKGYTSERVAQLMKKQDITSAILNLGGNVQLVGAKPDGSSWKVAIKNPDEKEEYLGVLSAQDTAVITSGGYERYFEEDGVRYHHIIDTQTGMPADKGLQSVTIVCADGTLADGLSTALYVMGTDAAIDFWRAHAEEFDAILYTDDRTLYVTEGIADAFTSDYSITVVH